MEMEHFSWTLQFARAATPRTTDGLKQQKLISSQFWRPESEVKVSASCSFRGLSPWQVDSNLCIFTWSSLCTCLSPNSLTTHIGLRHALRDSFLRQSLLGTPYLQIGSHSEVLWVRTSTYEFEVEGQPSPQQTVTTSISEHTSFLSLTLRSVAW